ncbi:glycoside hydrolase family 79 protein [Panaeolus papilionaceus]|nr:glycoside hydrolase family 79 protein [Panaeolus papilionaceus]
MLLKNSALLFALTSFGIHGIAAVTVYGLTPLGQMPLNPTATPTDAAPPVQTTLAAYNNTELIPPPIPNPAPATAFTLTLQQQAAGVPFLSIPHVGPSFWGFSIEMSVLTQVLGKNSSNLGVPFLNLLANLQERAGGVNVRIGGNTQEFAVMVEPDSELLLPYHTFGKTLSGSTQTTLTPAVLYTIDMFYIASNISSLLNVKWFLGIPFNDTQEWRLAIAEHGQAILGDNLLGLQAGNEPDLYERFKHRQGPYTPMDYSNEVADLIATVDNNPNLPQKSIFIGPSIASKGWQAEDVWATGYIDRFKDRFYCFSVENYPWDNCAAQFDTGAPHVDVQERFPYYMNHHNLLDHVGKYGTSSELIVATGKPLIMFETNTASCGGFAGISDSYGAALWVADYGFLMAHYNFTHGMLHVGGQNAFYNPFTAPPTNQSQFNQWTVGSVYYSTIVLAEALGKTNTARVTDLRANADSPYTPAYAIYENDILSKVALFNYIDDRQTGTNTIRVTINVPQGVPVGGAKVKYLHSHSVSSKNITWAGQTLGPALHVDGRFKGTLDVRDVPCNAQANTCTVEVPAPGLALVFLDSSNDVLDLGQATQTFSTSAFTRLHNTAVIDPTDLATHNGHSGDNRNWSDLGSTSHGSVHSQAVRLTAQAGVLTFLSLICAAAWLWSSRT